MTKKEMAVRHDSLGYNPDRHNNHGVKIDSLSYQGEESDAFRAYAAAQHYRQRGHFFNDGKREIMIRYIILTLIGVFQGCIAYGTNVVSRSFITVSIKWIFLFYVTQVRWKAKLFAPKCIE